MKRVLSVYIEQDGNLSVAVEPYIGLMIGTREEVFDAFDSELIADETQKLLNVIGEKLGLKMEE